MRKSLLAGFAAGVAALLAVPSLSSAAPDEVFQSTLGELLVKGSGPLVSFDISWVDPDLGGSGLPFYFLADRSHAQIDSIPIGVNPPSFFIKNAAFPFSGTTVCPDTGSTTDCAGPNGVLSLVGPDDQFEIWAGDGPTANAFCPAGFSPCSTVKVFQNFTANLLAVIPTATGSKFPGAKRADELCFAKATGAHPGTILVANDADDTPYITFIATDGPKRMTILNQIAFPEASAGIEQCQFDPNGGTGEGLFYLNLPEDSGAGGMGAIVVFDPLTLTELFRVHIDPSNCEHPQGMAIDSSFHPSHVLLGCNGATTGGTLDSLVVFGVDDLGVTVPGGQLTNQGAADEVWFEPVSHHFFLAEGRCGSNCGPGAASPPPLGNKQGLQTLGIFDSTHLGGPPGEVLNDPFFGGQNVFVAFQGNTTRNAHSVAAWSGTLGGLGDFTIAFVPVPATGGAPAGSGTAGYSSTLCNQFSAQGCIAMISVSPIPGGPEF